MITFLILKCYNKQIDLFIYYKKYKIVYFKILNILHFHIADYVELKLRVATTIKVFVKVDTRFTSIVSLLALHVQSVVVIKFG